MNNKTVIRIRVPWKKGKKPRKTRENVSHLVSPKSRNADWKGQTRNLSIVISNNSAFFNDSYHSLNLAKMSWPLPANHSHETFFSRVGEIKKKGKTNLRLVKQTLHWRNEPGKNLIRRKAKISWCVRLYHLARKFNYTLRSVLLLLARLRHR